MPEFISVGEFERFAKNVDDKLNRILDHAEKQDDRYFAMQRDIANLKANQARAGKLSATLSAVVSAVVTGVFHAIGGLGGVK